MSKKYTLDEVRGYMTGIADVIEGDIPRELFDKAIKMMKNVKAKEVTKYIGGTTVIERVRPYWYWYGDSVWCSTDNTAPVVAPGTTTFNSSTEAYTALGKSDAMQWITGSSQSAN